MTTGNTAATNANVFNRLNQAGNVATVVSAQSIDSLFLRLPSSAELDRLILGADSVGILKTIQTVATDDSIPCGKRIAYLSELLGRIRAAVELKTFAAEQLKWIIDGARTEIARLQSEIDRNIDGINKLNLTGLNDDLSKALVDLEHLYNRFNIVESEIIPNQAKLAGYNIEIDLLTKTADQERNRIGNNKLKIIDVEATIRDLQKRLNDAQNIRAGLNEAIAKSSDIINEVEAKIRRNRDLIQKLEDEIRALRNETDSLRGQTSTLEIQVERYRTEINVAEAKKDTLIRKNNDLNDRITIEKKKLADVDLADLQNMIAALNRMVPTTTKEIDRHYYNCYGPGSIETVETGGVVVYIVRGDGATQYLQGRYGLNPQVTINGDVRLQSVSIFNSQWTDKFGYPAVISRGGKDDFGGMFSCMSSSSSVKGYGTIVSIGADYLEARDKSGRNQRFNLSTCSRLESASSLGLPVIGQQFYYEAYPGNTADYYNLVSGSCI